MGCFPSPTRAAPAVNSEQDCNDSLPKANLRIEASSFVGKRSGDLRDNYILGAKVGSGGFGFVRLATHRLTSQQRAVKTIKKQHIVQDIKDRAKFFSEVDVLRATDHPNIVRLYEFYEDDKYFHLVTEYIPGGELFDFIIKSKLLSEPIAAHFMKQLFSAMAYCHSNHIVHRDIKPENLLLDREAPDATLKVIDFGTCTIQDSSGLNQRYGTAYYIAPEVLSKNYNEKCDIWSCGVILYILLSGKPPFSGKEDKDILRKVHKGEYSMKGPEWDRVSVLAKKLIGKMLDYNPRTRISASEAMHDEWIILNSSNNVTATDCLVGLSNLQAFCAEQQLQHTVLAFIASNLLSTEESKQLTDTFQVLDRNGDGKLSKAELLEAYTQEFGLEEATRVVDKIMRQVDINGSGFIDYTEFLMASTKIETLLSKSNIEAAFRMFDKDDSGKISARELKELFCGQNTGASDSMWTEIIKEVDDNGDGEIDIAEFTEMLYKLLGN